MRLSHSKLTCILDCPMTYYLRYKQGISLKEKKAALTIGSDVHWGLEHNTDDLHQYFIDEGRLAPGMPYSREHMLAEAMVHGFLHRKKELFDKILTNPIDGSKLTLVEETHELEIIADLQSFVYEVPNEFLGIIDLLLLVQDEKGNLYFIILDYKTSSSEPEWDGYLDQVYRYIFIVQSKFPTVPVLKIGIINLVKSKTKMLRGESEQSFSARIKREYEYDLDLINYHEFATSKLNKKVIDDYILNLKRQADVAATLDLNNAYYINYGNAVGKYGKSDYYDIFYHVEYAYVQYTIRDTIYSPTKQKMFTTRDCKPLDMLVIDHFNVLNKYEQFKAQALAYYAMHNDMNRVDFLRELREKYITDEDLLTLYWDTLIHEMESTK